MSTLLFKILNYEAEVYNNYKISREKLLNYLQTIEINNLSEEKVLIFINDLKQVIDPIITSQKNIEYLLENNLESNESIKLNLQLKEIFNLYLLRECLRLGRSSELEESSELSELSETERSDSDSDSELSELSV
jgi:hypothetical protein